MELERHRYSRIIFYILLNCVWTLILVFNNLYLITRYILYLLLGHVPRLKFQSMNSGFRVWLGDRFETPYRKLFEHRRITESNLHGLDNTRCYTLDMNGNSHASIKLGDEQERTRVHVLAVRRLHCFESMSFNIISRVLSTKNLKVFSDNILNIWLIFVKKKIT